MDKDELKEYLRDNLKVKVEVDYGDCYTPSSISVILLLEGEQISYDNDSLR